LIVEDSEKFDKQNPGKWDLCGATFGLAVPGLVPSQALAVD
jgi:hypothetical protein